jgi:hypothetical protein
MSDSPQMTPSNDHEWILALSGSLTSLAKNVERFVQAQTEMNQRLEQHIEQPGHLLAAELLKQHDTRLTGLEKGQGEVKGTVEDHTRRWKLVARGGAVALSLLGGGTGLGLLRMMLGI